MTAEFDVAVVGGGLVGAALAWGIARAHKRVVVLDEGDVAHRASRANFALVWVQSKGLGMPEYAAWTKRSSDAWQGLAQELEQTTGIDVAFSRPGGFTLALSEAELEARSRLLQRLHNQPNMVRYPYEILDRGALLERLPRIGPEVVGASHCPLDGQCNSLRLLYAFHAGMRQLGVEYRPSHVVRAIDYHDGVFVLRNSSTAVRTEKVVLAAGIGNARLASMVGLKAPVRPQRGQVVVTERAERFLDHPLVTIRQTDEGTVMLGDSQEEAGLDDSVGLGVAAAIASRAVRMFPLLASLNVVRTWAGLRVMTQDGFPIYDESSSRPGAFLATCHSGVTLAAAHALVLAPMIAAGSLSAELDVFSARRFDVQTAA
jgi:glycine/D-amino acid oxidase-like deaminating enzyme